MDLQQIRQLQAIGRTLQQARQEQDILLEEVYAKTFIQARLLKAIEAGNVDILPEPIFVQGFIKRYANLLGLDGATMAEAFMKGSPVAESHTSTDQPLAEDQLLAEPVEQPLVVDFPKGTAAVSGYEDNQETIEDSSPSTVVEPLPALKQLKLKDSSLNRSPWFKPPAWVYVVIGAVIVSVGLANLVNTLKLREKVVKPSSSPVSSPQPDGLDPSQAVASEKPSPEPASPIQIEVKLTSESWVQVEIDGKTEFEGVLGKGEERNWQAKSKLNLQAGNAGGVIVSLNGEEAKPLGSPGEVTEVTYTPESVSQ